MVTIIIAIIYFFLRFQLWNFFLRLLAVMSSTSQSKKASKRQKSNGKADNNQSRAFFHIPSTSVNSAIAIDGPVDPTSLGLSEAELYLLSVRAEEASLPAFTKALNPYAVAPTASAQPSGAEHQQESVILPAVIGPSASPRHPFLPSKSWRSSFLLHFYNLRQNLRTIPYNSKTHPSMALPKASDELAWCQFIFGTKQRLLADLAVAEAIFVPTSRDVLELTQVDEEAALNEAAEPDDWELDDSAEEGYSQDDEEAGVDKGDDEEEQMNDHAEEEDNVPDDELEPFNPDKHSPREPTMSVLKAMSDKTVIYLLKHITSWITDPPSNIPGALSPSIPPILAHWSFSLLARLDAHLLSGESISDLRLLARACLAVIERQLELHTADQEGSNVTKSNQCVRQEDENERMACWMIWELVIEVWKQTDLRQEEEALFK